MKENDGKKETVMADLIQASSLAEFEVAFAALGDNFKAKDVDTFNRKLIRQKTDVSFLRPLISEDPQYFRTFFQVSLAYCPTAEAKLEFVEEHFDLLQDWWHTDILIPFLGKDLEFSYALEKARTYVASPLPYVRRWGYVLFIPRLVRDPAKIEPLFSLFKNDDVHHVIMAQAWLISYLAMCDPDRTLRFLRECDLNYQIAGRAIQKICDSYVVTPEDKARFKALRSLWK